MQKVLMTMMIKVILLVGVACLLMGCQARPSKDDDLRAKLRDPRKVVNAEHGADVLDTLAELEGKRPQEGDKPSRLEGQGSRPPPPEGSRPKDEQDGRRPQEGSKPERKEKKRRPKKEKNGLKLELKEEEHRLLREDKGKWENEGKWGRNEKCEKVEEFGKKEKWEKEGRWEKEEEGRKPRPPKGSRLPSPEGDKRQSLEEGSGDLLDELDEAKLLERLGEHERGGGEERKDGKKDKRRDQEWGKEWGKKQDGRMPRPPQGSRPPPPDGDERPRPEEGIEKEWSGGELDGVDERESSKDAEGREKKKGRGQGKKEVDEPKNRREDVGEPRLQGSKPPRHEEGSGELAKDLPEKRMLASLY